MDNKYERKIKDYTKNIQQNIDQKALLQTISKCRETFAEAEDYPLSYMEFLYEQMRFIKKRWWILQGCLLVVLWFFLNDAADVYEMQRLLGAGACMFAIFLVPEIWKSRRNQAMEIEGAAYYSLRHICMARILLFGFTIYQKISGPVWGVALIVSIGYLIYVVKRSQSFYGEIYEVEELWS